MTRSLLKESFGSSALWLPTGSVLMRNGFSIEPGDEKCYELDDFTGGIKYPETYAIFLSRHPDFDMDLLNIVLGEIIGYKGGRLESASFKNLSRRHLVSRKEGFATIDSSDGKRIGLYTDMAKTIGTSVFIAPTPPDRAPSVSPFDPSYTIPKDILYQTKQPILIDYKKTLLS